LVVDIDSPWTCEECSFNESVKIFASVIRKPYVLSGQSVIAFNFGS